ncbi:HGGxSTG domain-containing protein [Niveibacterium sp. SC-1]|uniref:HGGxSTG domain-containing protein n=1 Tax=Niveibacterium sp. SC-1 TaxID=3135646 RepID=UPI00311D53BC
MTEDKRKRLKVFARRHAAVSTRWRERGYSYPPPVFPPIPADLAGMSCGAKTQAGTPCKLTAIYENGRCKWHGGPSTGPKTEAGKEQARINGRKGGRPRKTKAIDTEKS